MISRRDFLVVGSLLPALALPESQAAPTALVKTAETLLSGSDWKLGDLTGVFGTK